MSLFEDELVRLSTSLNDDFLILSRNLKKTDANLSIREEAMKNTMIQISSHIREVLHKIKTTVVHQDSVDAYLKKHKLRMVRDTESDENIYRTRYVIYKTEHVCSGDRCSAVTKESEFRIHIRNHTELTFSNMLQEANEKGTWTIVRPTKKTVTWSDLTPVVHETTCVNRHIRDIRADIRNIVNSKKGKGKSKPALNGKKIDLCEWLENNKN